MSDRRGHGILITGGSGFIGSNFNLNFGYKLTRKDVDLLDYNATVAFFKGLRPHTVIHTAGKIGGIVGNISAKGDYYLENILINTHVLEACRQAGVQNVVSLLSTCIYPKTAPLPYKEDFVNLGEPFEDHFGYAYAKRMLAIQSQAYKEQYGGNYLCLVLPNVYGPGDHMNRVEGHVIPSLVSRVLMCKKSREPFVVWGSGNPLREVMYVEDVVSIVLDFLSLMQASKVEDILINVGPGIAEEYTIRDIAFAIAREFNYVDDIKFNTNMPDGQFRKTSSIERRQKYLPDFEYTSLESGLRRWHNILER